MSTEATVIVHWPGQDTPACDFHSVKLMNLAAHMGFRVSATPCLLPMRCANCENQAARIRSNAERQG